jgi:hypothetical protein
LIAEIEAADHDPLSVRTRGRQWEPPYLFSSNDAALCGRIGAFVLHSTHDPRETTAKAREAFRDRFLKEVDPRGELSEEERTRRADYALKAYMARLALASARARARGTSNDGTAAPDPSVIGGVA